MNKNKRNPWSKRFFTDQDDLAELWSSIRKEVGTIVFTNGCFDILHAGHVSYLEEAKSLGDFLVIGLNSDQSIQSLKGPTRPVITFDQRAFVLAGLKAVDLVVGFNEQTPEKLIHFIHPHILVKGGDWRTEDIVGSEFVMRSGGKVRSLQFKEGLSTTQIIEKASRT